MNIYRVVNADGTEVSFVGRRSDPFTRKASAKSRASQLTNEARRYSPEHPGYKVQVSYAEWEDLNE